MRGVERVDGGEGKDGCSFDMDLGFVELEDTFGNGDHREENDGTCDSPAVSTLVS